MQSCPPRAPAYPVSSVVHIAGAIPAADRKACRASSKAVFVEEWIRALGVWAIFAIRCSFHDNVTVGEGGTAPESSRCLFAKLQSTIQLTFNHGYRGSSKPKS